MNGESLDIPADNREKLKQLFPSVFTETVNDKGELLESIDFEKLKAELGTFTDLFENRRERYGMDWPGKKETLRLIQTPSVATLKPCREESVNFDTTENLFIEGDNLEVLKLLQKSYYGKVKMICIDPPYNTGKEFIYPDNYSESLETYLEYAGLIDGNGKKFSTNTPNEGRFHTKWLNMMYPRLYLARNLMRDDGVIFISIDDNEVHNLRMVMNEIFGDENFLAQFAWRTDGNFDNQAKFKKCHEYILVYGKNADAFPPPPIIDPNTPQDSKLFLDQIRNTIVKNGPKNPISSITLPVGFPSDIKKGTISARTDSWPHYKIAALIKDGKLQNQVVVESGWSSKELLEEFISIGCNPIVDSKGQETSFTISQTGAIEVIKKRSTEQSHVITALNSFGGPQKAAAEIEALGVVFDDYPKPTDLIKYFVTMNKGNDFIILDFFSGSATTAHAVLDLNKQDGGNRKFILVQLPEPCAEDSEAFKTGYKTIADIGKERIRRVIKKLNDEQKGKLALKSISAQDRGFKVLKLNKSNFKQWQKLTPDAAPEQIAKQLSFHIDHIDHKATPEDLLYEILLKTGFTPTEKVQPITLAEIPVFSIADGGLLICLAKAVTKELINAVAEAEPMQFICLDSAFKGNDQLKANTVQTFNARNIGKEKHNQIVFKTV